MNLQQAHAAWEAWTTTMLDYYMEQMMDNQHRKITGYRELSQDEIDQMNEIKEAGKQLGALIDKVQDHGGDPRCAAHAKTQLQDGIMWLTRAVTKPEFF